MPVLSCCVSTVCELLKIAQVPVSPGKVYTAGPLDREAGTVNPQVLFISTVRSHDGFHSSCPCQNVQSEKSCRVNQQTEARH